MTSAISFAVQAHQDGGGLAEVVPVVDGVPLTELIEAFEHAAGIAPLPSGHGGLIPALYRHGPAIEHYTATRDGTIPLLGCNCGETGCWSLVACVRVQGDLVTWSGFERPGRTAVDYSSFGPFAFDRIWYDHAVSGIAAVWAAESPGIDDDSMGLAG